MPKSRACANSPALSRRNLMAGMTASSLTVAFASEVKADPMIESDPILPIYRDWWAARIEWHRAVQIDRSWEGPEAKAAEAREYAAFSKIMQATPISLEGIAALAHVLFSECGPETARDLEAEYLEECEWPQNKLIATIWRAASGKSGLPPHYTTAALGKCNMPY